VDSLEPIAVSIPRARHLLGDKCNSELYAAINEGHLVALKDGRKTLITVESIRAYMAALPRGTSMAALGEPLSAQTKARVLGRRRTAKRRPTRSHRSPKSSPPPDAETPPW
jgi:hypothetical protein